MPPSAIMGRLSESQEKFGGKNKKSKALSLEYKASRISERLHISKRRGIVNLLKTLEVDNFKSLCQLKIDFSRLNVLIGTNSVGKSSILQAIDLLSHFADGSISDYLAKRNWQPSELKSKLYHASKRNITFSATFQLENSDNIRWEFTLAPKKEENTFICVREKVFDLDAQKNILIRESKKMIWYDFSKRNFEEFPEMQLYGSMLSLINPKEDEYVNRFPQLSLLKRYVMGIKSFELLSPEKIKRTSRYDAADLGIGGERLGAFLHSLSSNKRQVINEKIKEFYPFASGIVTSKKQYGHVHLQMNESFKGVEPYAVNANYLSDGILRIMAILSLGALGESYTALLLDEIEDGINPWLAAKLIDYIDNVSTEYHKQIFVTTHSPVILSYFDKDSIILLWRNKDGMINANKMFESPDLQHHLEFMNPGEVWLNMEPNELEEALIKSHKALLGEVDEKKD